MVTVVKAAMGERKGLNPPVRIQSSWPYPKFIPLRNHCLHEGFFWLCVGQEAPSSPRSLSLEAGFVGEGWEERSASIAWQESLPTLCNAPGHAEPLIPGIFLTFQKPFGSESLVF